ncbi:fructose-bisphosphate aldolase [Halobellus salinus]|uniref:fructose-bisphosphate aldolase n=1 Tax=Halobellus salinus TaxID=931585 RepID=A0A830ELV1_9EURY|nr:fructose-1,6-bisphosphate aldolase [Halobellus salinus]GGJ01687.1 fructose-bisphosphate aldolase [Halobellus salinus]SMP18328.1 fructose-bisphosphate aldolase, class I [Halobellus salinus]
MNEDAVVVAIDHGLHWGSYDDFADREATLRTLLEANVDGLLAGVPFLQRFQSLVDDYDVHRIATLDLLHNSTIPGGDDGNEIHTQVFSPETAVGVGADAAKMALVYGRSDPAVLSDNLDFVADAAEVCNKVNLPLVVEPMLWGQEIDDEFNGEMLADAARIAFELGADVLKTPYPGAEEFTQMVENAPVPVYIAGGPAVESDWEVLEMVAGARDAGGLGVMFGRNVWQREDPEAVVTAFRRIIHDGASVDEAAAALEGV